MKPCKSCSILTCAAIATCYAGLGWTADHPLKRWAIIADEGVQESGVADLLTLKLSKVDGVELLEREQLVLATKELELSAVIESNGVAKRLQLGKLVGADALVLLMLEERDKHKLVRLVIADCSYGARLHFEYLPYDASELDRVAERCTTVVRTTRKRFVGGIRHIVCVPPFLSKNFTHKHDHLQLGFASLLKGSLSDLPGVALVETEEAKAVGLNRLKGVNVEIVKH